MDAGELRLPETKTGAKVVHLGEPVIAILRGMDRREDNPWVIAGRKPGANSPICNTPGGASGRAPGSTMCASTICAMPSPAAGCWSAKACR